MFSTGTKSTSEDYSISQRIQRKGLKRYYFFGSILVNMSLELPANVKGIDDLEFFLNKLEDLVAKSLTVGNFDAP